MLLVALLVLLVTGWSDAAISADLITSLPGLEKLPSFSQYSGYLKALDGRQLHYWFIESAGNPSKDPVVLWLNGGPGCSSLDGLLTEHGPFRVGKGGKTLTEHPYSWNKLANMLYLEAPAGVGYSYSDSKNYTTNDDQVSLNNYWALKYFFGKFDEFAKNDFYITGESYGGIYVPTLSVRVMSDSSFNFKGMAVGNGISDYFLNGQQLLYFGFSHGLWGPELWREMLDHCCSPDTELNCTFYKPSDPKCSELVHKAHSLIGAQNIYNLYAPCYKGPDHDYKNLTVFNTAAFLVPQVHKDEIQKLRYVQPEKLMSVPPCINALAPTQYMNRDDVRKALHISPKLPKWEICSGIVGAGYKTMYSTMREQYLAILGSQKLRVMVYNGDVDMACNFLGDEWFVDQLKQPVVKEREMWYYTDDSGTEQVAGFVKHFRNMAFVTIKGAGHMVPTDKPVPALIMFKNFLKGASF